MDNRPVAGIDVSKYFSDMCILGPDNAVAGELHFAHTFEGMTKAKALLDSAAARFGVAPVAVMESTSHYHRMFFYFLKGNGYDAIVVNPLQTGAMKNINIRKVKTDRADAKRIALLYRLKELRPTNAPIDTLFELRSLTRQHSDLVKTQTMYTNRLISELDQVFPHFPKAFSSVHMFTALAILDRYPSPEAILAAERDELRELIVKTSRRGVKYAEDKVNVLIEFARRDTLINISFGSSAALIRSNIQMLKVTQENLRMLETEVLRLVKSEPNIYANAMLLDSIPGVALYGAALLLAEIGDFRAFKKPPQLVAYFGLDPSVRQSGMFKGTKNKLSKRGSHYLRQFLNMVAVCSISKKRSGEFNNQVLSEYYHKKAASKPHKVALCAVMHKLVYVIFAVLRDQKPFELRQPEAHAAWLIEKNREAA